MVATILSHLDRNRASIAAGVTLLVGGVGSGPPIKSEGTPSVQWGRIETPVVYANTLLYQRESRAARRVETVHMCRYVSLLASIASASPGEGWTMKLKIFSAKSGNRKPVFESPVASVNEWPADRPNVVIENVDDLSQPNMSWSHLAVVGWYIDR